MRRDQLEHAIRTACQIIGRPEVIVLGSQAILGTFREDELPVHATMSGEVDILPIADTRRNRAARRPHRRGGRRVLMPGRQARYLLGERPLGAEPIAAEEPPDLQAISTSWLPPTVSDSRPS